jgi:hypothetical protein
LRCNFYLGHHQQDEFNVLIQVLPGKEHDPSPTILYSTSSATTPPGSIVVMNASAATKQPLALRPMTPPMITPTAMTIMPAAATTNSLTPKTLIDSNSTSTQVGQMLTRTIPVSKRP